MIFMGIMALVGVLIVTYYLGREGGWEQGWEQGFRDGYIEAKREVRSPIHRPDPPSWDSWPPPAWPKGGE